LFRRKCGRPLLVWLIATLPWIALALVDTWATAKEAFIDWSNWRWILSNAGTDLRGYELNWIIRGWIAVFSAALIGLVVVRTIVSGRAPVES
jgi:hypothetical protein